MFYEVARSLFNAGAIRTGTVTRIDEAAITIKNQGIEYQIPAEKIFPGVNKPTLSLQHSVVRGPFQVCLGEESIFILDGPFIASRATAISLVQDEILGRPLSINRRLEVEIVEIHRDYLLAVDDQGIPVKLSTPETICHLKKRFKKRLRPYVGYDRGVEPFWLYPGDRILVEASGIENFICRCLIGNIVVRNVTASRITERDNVDFLDKEFELPYADVLLATRSEHLTRIVESEIRRNVHVVRSHVDLEDWALAKAEADLSQKESSLVLLIIDRSIGGIIDSFISACGELLNLGVRIEIVICTGNSEAEKTLSLPKKKEILGTWDPRTGVYRLLELADNSGAEESVISSLASNAIGPVSTGTHAVRINFDAEFKSIFKEIIEVATPDPSTAAVILFSIDSKGHGVRIEHKYGSKRIVEGFEAVKIHLHKSPVRDLAIGGFPSDSDNANSPSDRNRFLYFLDAMIGDAQKAKLKGFGQMELSCRGFSLDSPFNDDRRWVCFLVADKAGAFQRINQKWARATVEQCLKRARLLLLSHFTYERVEHYRDYAIKANDFSFLAHEIQAALDTAVEVISAERRNPEERISEIQKILGDAQLACEHLFPATKKGSPGSSIDLKVLTGRICRAELLKGKPKIVINSEYENIEESSHIWGKPLVLACALRNLLSNSRHQIRDYGLGKGTITITYHLEIDSLQTYLVVKVADDGPGIHAKYQGLISSPGFTNRKAGRGLGLAAIVRASNLQEWGGSRRPSLKLSKSILYQTTEFIFKLPIELE